MHRVELARRWSPRQAAVVLGLCAFAVLGWQGVTTVGRDGGVDSGEHLAYAQYLDAHGRIPSKAENYEYSTRRSSIAAIGAEHAVSAAPSAALELPWNPATRGLFLLLVAAGVIALTSSRRRVRIGGLAALGLGVLWGLDEAVSLTKSEPWSAAG